MYSPLEQFENHLFYSFDNTHNTYLHFNLTSFSISLFCAFTFCCILFFVGVYNPRVLPTSSQSIAENFYKAVFSMVSSQTGPAGAPYFPYVFTLFTFIFCCNFLGLVPFSFTPTAQIFIPFFLAFVSCLALLVIGFYKHGVKFLKLFVPDNMQVALLALVTPIELSTYLMRPFSLALRLFANIIAGHTLLFICSMTLYIGFMASNIFIFFGGYILVFAVFMLELLISFLQAYVFSVLFCVYLNDSLHPGH